MKVPIGIDPGKNGGISWIDDYGIHAHKLPETLIEKNRMIRKLAEQDCYVVLEKVHTSPQMGVRSAGTFMQGRGELLALLVSHAIPFEEVSPTKWMRAMDCLTGGDKNITKRKAQSLFPWVKVTHAIADSMLLAEYCRQHRML